jgi:rRNA maturation protein Nop10
MDKCPMCGENVRDITSRSPDGSSYQPAVQCLERMCPFNFPDDKCPNCGKPVAIAREPYHGRYDFECAEGHTWKKEPA